MEVIKTKRLIFSFLLCLLLFSSSASAWEESFEGHWGEIAATNYQLTDAYIDSDSGFICMQSNQHTATIQINESYLGYLRYNTVPSVSGGTLTIQMYAADGTTVYSSSGIWATYTASSYNIIELIETEDRSTLSIYCNGVSQGSTSRLSEKDIDIIKIAQYCGYDHTHFDDFSTSPFMIGTPGFMSVSSGTIYSSVSVPIANNYHVTLSKSSGEEVERWNITSKCQLISYSVNTYFSDDGFYYYNIYDAAGKLYYSKLLYYNSLGIYPTSYFSISSDTAADIRDKDLNGGAISGGGTIYLYPSETTNNFQNFTIEFQQPAYNRQFTISKIFNTSQIDGSKISLTGLSPNIYNVSLDNVYLGSTGGSNSYDYTVNWIGDNSYIFELSPDFSSPGAWGYVKDSTTQEKIPYALLYLFNTTFSTTAYTDENGMYFIGGLEPGAYSIQASKKDYSSSVEQPFTAIEGSITRQDLYIESSSNISGEGLYYAPHSVTFSILEYWYNYTGLPGIPYSVYDNENGQEIKSGSTDSKGQFTVKEMDGGVNYTITLIYKGQNITKYVEPGLSEYTYVLNEEGALKKYMNSWLTLSYSQNSTNATVTYSSNKTLSGASLIATASNGTIVYNQALSTANGSFFVPFSPGDYSLQFHIEASDGSEASQVWTITNPATVNLFPPSYPAWLKNTLFTAIIIIFLLAFGKSKNDIACGSVAVLTSFGYFFRWLTCSFNFVVLVWIIAIAAILLHYRRTGAVG